jgi:hypothetical protein
MDEPSERVHTSDLRFEMLNGRGFIFDVRDPHGFIPRGLYEDPIINDAYRINGVVHYGITVPINYISTDGNVLTHQIRPSFFNDQITVGTRFTTRGVPLTINYHPGDIISASI